MKKLTVLLMFLMAAGVTLTSCNDDDDPNPTGSAGNMSLKVDGTSWSASLAVQAVNSSGVLTITGSDSNAKQCNITLLNVPGTGTYDIGGSLSAQNNGRWTGSTNPNDTYSTMVGQGSGSCTITELTASKVSGTFQFTAKNTLGNMVTITEGSFSANISK